jgi:site-specific recombinase XerD
MTPLPEFAREYLRLQPLAAVSVQRFHAWLRASHRPLKQLEHRELAQFLATLAAQPLSKATRALHLRRTRHYLEWLRGRQLLRAPTPSPVPPLPELPSRFIQALTPTHKPSTLNGYRSTLRRFHGWLSARSLAPRLLTRNHIESWLQEQHQRGLHANTRLHAIQHVRHYLRWLEDHDELSSPADALLRGKDLPKLPLYLPRPIPPDIDRILQKRLRSSRDRFQLGLLLMRNTGLRIGELRMLHHRCVRVDPRGNHFLKVPLGKLDNERLVPLDSPTLRLLRRLQRLGEGHRRFLFERNGKPIRFEVFNLALKTACRGLSTPEPITSHRLRHTYATTLLAGGMSLVALMRLLGHRDYRMTLRYAAITDETVLTEFNNALLANARRYVPDPSSAPLAKIDPLAHLLDVVRYVQKRSADADLDPIRTSRLVKRIQRLRAGIQRHFDAKGPTIRRGN